MPEFNRRLYEASLETLLTASVPREIAEAASKVVASDDTSQPNNGRTAENQQAVNTAMEHYWRGQREQQ